MNSHVLIVIFIVRIIADCWYFFINDKLQICSVISF